VTENNVLCGLGTQRKRQLVLTQITSICPPRSQKKNHQHCCKKIDRGHADRCRVLALPTRSFLVVVGLALLRYSAEREARCETNDMKMQERTRLKGCCATGRE